MLVDEDRVSQNGVGAEKADIGRIFERRLAVPVHDLVEFDLRLRNVGREPAPRLAREGGRVAQGGFGAGLDLSGKDDAAKPAARLPLRLFHHANRRLEGLPPLGLIPLDAEAAPASDAPAGVGEIGSDIETEAAPRRAVQPPFHRPREIDHGRDAGQQKFGVGHLHSRPAAVRVQDEGAHALIEPGVVHLRDAMVLPHTLVGGFGMGMRMKVDETRHRAAARAVDGPVRGAFVAAADLHDPVPRKGDISVAEIAVAVAVPGCDPRRIADHGGVVAHRFASRP